MNQSEIIVRRGKQPTQGLLRGMFRALPRGEIGVPVPSPNVVKSNEVVSSQVACQTKNEEIQEELVFQITCIFNKERPLTSAQNTGIVV
mmetsp:Transcript_4051/g.6167  ORF Transcript_4051/g.6167 Transcript_4051/m.6167 type:complete len:89 (-) Transcript_4051:289-555(-)